MNSNNVNYTALANTARECAQLANGVSGTIKWIVAHWNLCCQQAELITFTTEARYTRRAALAADMLRMAEQLDRLANGCDAITGEPVAAPVEAVEPVEFVAVDEVEEVPVVDIKAGMWVQNPLVSGQFQQVEEVAHIGNDLMTIRFNWNMGTQTFVYGETLIVRVSNNDAQTPNVLINPEGENTMTNQKVNTVVNAVVRAILNNRSDIEEVTTEQVQALQNMIAAQAHFLTLNSEYTGTLYATDESLAKAASYFYQFLANGADVQGWIDSQIQSLAEVA